MPKKLTTEEFIARACNIHNSIYEYTQVVYVNNSTKVKIYCTICETHFQQAPNYHLLGQGCPTCGRKKCDTNRRLTTKQFIARSKEIHSNYYTYEKTVYQHNTKDVTITCPNHGDFTQQAYNHLKGHGCQRCGNGGYSKKAIQWLKSIERSQNIHIQHILNGGEFIIPGTRYKADGYCAETNTIYEFYGDKWHGNLNVYDPDTKCHPFSEKTAQELHDETITREQTIRNLGYKVIIRWETS